MRILYLYGSLDTRGGIERVINNKTNWFVNHGHEVTVLLMNQGGRPVLWDFDPRVKIVDLGADFQKAGNSGNIVSKGLRFAVAMYKFRARVLRYLRENPADVVVSALVLWTLWLPFLKDGSRKVVETHFSKYSMHTYGPYDRFRRWVFGKKYDNLVVLTHEDKADWGDLPNIEVIPNTTSFASEGGASLDNKQVIAVGRLARQKRFDLLIEAWEKIHKKHPDWKLSIYGNGSLQEELQAQIESVGLQEVVTIYPATTEIKEKYKESSILALSSDYEGFGMVLVEAMSVGVPCVSFTCKCGPRDIIENGVSGILVEHGDVDGLAAGIDRLIEDESLRKDMGRNAVERIRENFTEEVVMEKWENLFTKR